MLIWYIFYLNLPIKSFVQIGKEDKNIIPEQQNQLNNNFGSHCIIFCNSYHTVPVYSSSCFGPENSMWEM